MISPLATSFEGMKENIPMKQGIGIGLRTCSPSVFFQLEALEGQPRKHIHRSYQLVYLKNLLMLYFVLKGKREA